MDPNATRNIVEAALLAANASLSFDRLVELFAARGVDVDRSAVRDALSKLAEDYADREIELKETASGFRIQVKSSVREWLQPLFEERAPRYTRALLETLALIAYRQPITRAEIEDVRGVAVSSNIIRTLMERGWIRVVGYRDVPGHPSMLGTTREFLDYFGLKRLEDLPPLAEVRALGPDVSAQADLIDNLEAVLRESATPFQAESAAVDDVAESSEDAEPASNVVPIHQSEA
jgi:segregation and condensation protein B